MVESLPTSGVLVKKAIDTEIKRITKLGIKTLRIKKILIPTIDVETKRSAKNILLVTM